MAMPVFAADSAVTQVARGLAAIPSQLNFSTILANSQTADIIKAAERGLSGAPGEYRDLVIAPPRAAAGRLVPSVPRRGAAP